MTVLLLAPGRTALVDWLAAGLKAAGLATAQVFDCRELLVSTAVTDNHRTGRILHTGEAVSAIVNLGLSPPEEIFTRSEWIAALWCALFLTDRPVINRPTVDSLLPPAGGQRDATCHHFYYSARRVRLSHAVPDPLQTNLYDERTGALAARWKASEQPSIDPGVPLRLVHYDPARVHTFFLFSGQAYRAEPGSAPAGLPPALMAQGVLAEATVQVEGAETQLLSCNCPTQPPPAAARPALLEKVRGFVTNQALPG